MELHLKIAGYILSMLGLLHIFFPGYFKWKNDLENISLINRQMMYVHTFFIAFIVVLMGLLCITASTELIETSLGKKLALGLCIFWVTRLCIQFFGYSSKLWKGRKFETCIHILFSITWIYLSVIFFIIYWINDKS